MEEEILIPQGFELAGVHCGLKEEGPDLALISSHPYAAASAVYTKNKSRAACLDLCKGHEKNPIAALVVNSKIANALTGEKGLKNAHATAEHAAKKIGCEPRNVMVASTGVIGEQLPMHEIKHGIDIATQKLSHSLNNADLAIMTSDKYPKRVSKRFKLGGRFVTISLIAKGAGMIHPNMATMLAFVLSDINISKKLQKKALKSAVDKTFNRISVDGDCSTNDMVLMLSNNLAGNPWFEEDSAEYATFEKHLTALLLECAKMIVEDGEGASKIIKVDVKNAKSLNDAKKIAKTIATSSLVKTAFYGEDANWGRIVAAAGRTGAAFEPKKTTLKINSIKVFSKETAVKVNEEKLNKSMKKHEQFIELNCGYENGSDYFYYFSDLGHEYVSINSEYRT